MGLLTYTRDGGVFYSTTFGRFCSIAPNVFCGGGEHPLNWLSSHVFAFAGSSVFNRDDYYSAIAEPKNRKAQPGYGIETLIGNDVWIGQGCFISRGISIGDGAVIAAHSVVTSDVEPYAILAGVPAKALRKRFDEKSIERLLRVQWWLYDLSKVSPRLDYRNVNACLDTLEDLLAIGALPMLKPKLRTLRSEDGAYLLSDEL